MKPLLTSRIYLLAVLWASGCLFATAHAQTPTWDAAWTGGGAGASWAFGTAADASGNVFAAGRFAGFNVAFGPFTLSNTATPAGTVAANQNGYLAKYSSAGTVLWVRQASVTGFSSFSSVATDAAGNVYATGLYYGGALALGSATLPAPAAGTRPGFVMKYDSQGTLLWSRLLDTNNSAAGVAIAVAGGAVFVAGTFSGSLSAGTLAPLNTPTTANTDSDAFLLKLDAQGTPQWLRQAGGSSLDTGNAVAVDASGNAVLGGNFVGATLTAGSVTLTNAAAVVSLNSTDIFLVKYDAQGTQQWVQRAGGSGPSDRCGGLAAGPGGAFYLAGSLDAAGGTVGGTTFGAAAGTQNAVLAALSPTGASQWVLREGNGSSYAAVALDATNNLLVAGYLSGTLAIGLQTLISAGGTDLLTARYTAAGTLVGAGRAGGNDNDFGNATCSDPGNGQTVVGLTRSNSLTIATTSLNNYRSSQDALVIRYASGGSVAFARRLSSNGGQDSADKAVVDGQGNVYVVGYFTNNTRLDAATSLTTPQGEDGVFVAKYTPTGTVLWVKSLNNTFGTSTALDVAGNLYVAGTFADRLQVGSTTLTSTGGSGDADVFLLKYDLAGNLLWARSGGGTGFEESYGVAVNANGVVVLSGDTDSPSLTFGSQTVATSSTSNVNETPFLVRYDAAGTAQLARAYSSSGTGNVGAYSEAVAVDAAGNAFLAGDFRGTLTFGTTVLTSTSNNYSVFVAKISPAGSVLWARQSVSSATAYATTRNLAVDPAGNVALLGYSTGAATFGAVTLTPTNSAGFFLVKYDPVGTVLWGRQNNGTGTSNARGLAADAAGNFYVGGSYANGTAIFGSITLAVSSLAHAMVVRYDAQGIPQWAAGASGFGTASYVQSVAVATAGNLYVAGGYNNFLQLASNLSLLASESVGYDLFIARLAGAVPLATAAPRTAPPALAIYPNPARGAATARWPATATPTEILLLDALGRAVRRYSLPTGTETTLDLRGLPAGLYVLRYGTGSQRLVVE